MLKNQIKVSEENHIRMMRLSQEVIGKLTEMSMIVASTTKSTPHSLSEVTFKLPQKIDDSIQISFTSINELGIMAVGRYKDPPGICEPV
jgi:hypothetical protein